MIRPTTADMRQTGMDVVGDVAWGTHCCLFYETTADLLDTVAAYVKAGLDSGEFCLWVVAAPVTEEDAATALREVVSDLDRHLDEGNIEIVAAHAWYLQGGAFDLERVLSGWNEKLARALATGYAGVRVTGDTAWLERKDWQGFCEYEESLNEAIANQRLAVLCTYPLQACGAGEILDVVRTHQFAIAKRRGDWDVIETAGHKQAKAEIKRLNEALEQRVEERTKELSSVNRELMTEVLQRKRAEEALRRSEAYLAEAQRLSHTGSWAFNATTAVYWSEENFRIWGFDPRQGLPDREAVVQRIHPDDRDATVAAARTAVQERTDYVVEFRIVRPDGTVRYVNGSGHPVFNADGELVEVVGTQMDVTDRRRAEAEREQLQQLQADLAYLSRVTTMGELTASLAHEIRQPIAAALTDAKTCLRWLGRTDPDLQEGCEAAARVVKDVTRAADIISSISMAFKKGSLPRELLDANELIRELSRMLRSEASRHSITVRLELDPDVPRVLAERVQVQQVLMNLILNGIDAMKDTTGSHELRIESRNDDGHLLISVSDTGTGLAPEHLDQIFRPFFTTKPQGTGMGLPISRSIVESHGGRLWTTRNDPRGATFHFSLPTAVTAPEPAAGSLSIRRGSRTFRSAPCRGD